jgi:hypothetical protein
MMSLYLLSDAVLGDACRSTSVPPRHPGTKHHEEAFMAKGGFSLTGRMQARLRHVL